MAITWAQVLIVAPALTTGVPLQTEILAQVAAQMSVPDWNSGRLDIAAKYLAAHLATMIAKGPFAPSGPVTSKSVGPLSVSYAAPFLTRDALASTSYGLEYMRLRRMNSAARVGLVA